jgi:hypothetical protein
MLYASLNQHPAIALMYEPELQSHNLTQRHFLHENWLENANAWGKFLFRHGFPAYPKEAKEHFHCPEDFYKSYADRKQATYCGEKSPMLVGFLPEIFERFPEARIITISRNPVDILRSIQQAAKFEPWFARKRMLERSLYGQEKMLQDSILLQNQGRRILHLTYEEYTNNPEVECRRICDYLDLPFDPRMMTLEGADLTAVYDKPHHAKLHTKKITPISTQPQLPDISQEWIDLLQEHWKRTQESLEKLRSSKPAVDPLPAPSRKIQQAIRKGLFIHQRTKWKRSIYHLLPSEVIRIFRATKILIRNAQSIQTEKYSAPERILNRLIYSTFILAAIVTGGILHTTSHGQISPLPFFIFPVLAAGWFLRWKQILLFSLLCAIIWTLGPNLVGSAHTPPYWMAWNFISRTSLLLILGIFAWNLKATLLIHQYQKE